MKTLVIINSIAFKRRTRYYRFRLLKKLNKIPDTKLFLTEYAGHCVDLIKENKDAKKIIVAGGDGTIHEAVNAMKLDSQLLAIIPIGRGNSLARDLKIEAKDVFRKNYGKTIMALGLLDVEFKHNENKSKKLLAFSTCGIGTVVKIVKDAENKFKKLRSLSYLVAVIGIIKNYRVQSFNISSNNAKPVKEKISTVIINNTKHCGPYKMFPDNCLQNSSFSVLRFFRPKTKDFIVIFRASHKSINITREETKKIEISSKSSFNIMLDGELINDKHFVSFKRSEQSLSIIL